MEWISSKELMGAMGTRGFGSGSAQAQRVCKRAHAGIMRARAKTLYLGNERKDDEPVPAEFWFAEGHQALQQDWVSGDFSTWPTWLRRSQEWRAFGVEWSKEDAEAMGVSFTNGADQRSGPDTFSILDGAPVTPVESSFMGLMEAVAWVGLRDESATLAPIAEIEVDSEPLPIVPRGEVQAWIRSRIAAGETQTVVADTYREAFAAKRIKLSREAVREIYRAEYGATKGELRPGKRVKGE